MARLYGIMITVRGTIQEGVCPLRFLQLSLECGAIFRDGELLACAKLMT